MHWLQTIDEGLFRFVNLTMRNEVFDWLMPVASGNPVFFPALLVLGVLLACTGGRRAWICIAMLAIILPLGDGLVTNMLKHALARERPFLVLPDVHLLAGRSGSGSMPSAHAANWFAATLIAFVYYRRSLWFMLPCAGLVAFSRIYIGVHYPSDVLVGAVLGAGYAAAGIWLLERAWCRVGQKWFPLWWERLPSLVNLRSGSDETAEQDEVGEPVLAPASAASRANTQGARDLLALPRTRGIAPAGFVAPHVSLDAHWVRLGYLWIALLLALGWAYIASRAIQLSEDEAYQWLWSKHLALSNYSHPPFIAWVQFFGTTLWGNTAFGVRFFSPLIAAIISFMLLRFVAREVNGRAGFLLVLILNATPLLAMGSVLMTPDPLCVLFWTAAMLAGWRAVQEKATTRDWAWVGLWMGLGFLSKYTALFQWLCWATFFILWRPARKHLRRPGPYLALLINALCATPVLIWNYQHGWITVTHAAEVAGLNQTWDPSLRPALEFLGNAAALLNPIFFLAIVWASIEFWRRNRQNPRLAYCFSMGAPVFALCFLLSFRSRVFPNRIAPSVIPLLCLMVIYWDTRWRLGTARVRPWLVAGLVLGFTVVGLGHDTNVVEKLTHHYLPLRFDPLHRVREWDTTARVVTQVRAALLTEGPPVFIITDHRGIAGEVSFYSPDLRPEKEPLVYFLTSSGPENQFYFWPGYHNRKGENAVFVRELSRDNPLPLPAPESLRAEFASVTDLGVSNVWYHDRFLLRPLQFFACRGLK
jgi:membrane-associated phospholipid phosphatase